MSLSGEEMKRQPGDIFSCDSMGVNHKQCVCSGGGVYTGQDYSTARR